MRATAEGNIQKLVVFVIVFVAIVGVGTWIEPFGTEYGVKGAGKSTCNELISRGYPKNVPERWESKFVGMASAAGARLNNDQYNFEITSDNEAKHCHMVIAWRSTTPWFIIGDLLDVEPLKMVHRIDYVHTVRKSY